MVLSRHRSLTVQRVPGPLPLEPSTYKGVVRVMMVGLVMELEAVLLVLRTSIVLEDRKMQSPVYLVIQLPEDPLMPISVINAYQDSLGNQVIS